MEWSPTRGVLQNISSQSLTSRVDSQSNVVLIPQSFLTPSPEEQIIRQRSLEQRSAEHANIRPHALLFTEYENEHTPFKFGISALSRKRLLMTPPNDSSTPVKDKTAQASKKRRLSLKTTPPPLSKQLLAHSTEQLANMLDKLVTSHPELEEEVRDSLPAPDLKPLEENLKSLRKNVMSALPTTRWGSSRDSYCYRRCKLHLDIFKKSCVEQGRLLVRSEAWSSVLRYVTSAWRVIYQLPVWDEPAHNEHKKKCFQVLAAQCMVAIKKLCLDKNYLNDIRPMVKTCVQLNKEMSPCLKQLDNSINDNNNTIF